MFDTIKGIISTVAPTIAGALGGPLAAAGVTALENVFGLKNSTPDQLHQALLQMAPDQAIALKKQDEDFKIALQTAYTNQMKISEQALKDGLDDTADARSMQNDFVNKLRIESIRWLGIITIVCFSCCFYLYVKQDVNGNEGVLIGSTIAGILSLWGVIFGFLFGTGIDKILNHFNVNKDTQNVT